MGGPVERGLPDLTRLVGPVAVIETVRRRPVERMAHAKIVLAVAGSAQIGTEAGEQVVQRGDLMVLGGGRWCQATPLPMLRAAIYVDETFLRHHARGGRSRSMFACAGAYAQRSGTVVLCPCVLIRVVDEGRAGGAA